jgi:hypothetical protein
MTDRLRARSYTDTSSDSFRNIFLIADKINTDAEFDHPPADRKGHRFQAFFTDRVS